MTAGSPGSTPGRVGAAREGPVVQGEGVGFPQAHTSSPNAEYVCRYCEKPISVRESGEWGHTRLDGGSLRFWCRGPDRLVELVRVVPNDRSETPPSMWTPGVRLRLANTRPRTARCS